MHSHTCAHPHTCTTRACTHTHTHTHTHTISNTRRGYGSSVRLTERGRCCRRSPGCPQSASGPTASRPRSSTGLARRWRVQTAPSTTRSPQSSSSTPASGWPSACTIAHTRGAAQQEGHRLSATWHRLRTHCTPVMHAAREAGFPFAAAPPALTHPALSRHGPQALPAAVCRTSRNGMP